MNIDWSRVAAPQADQYDTDAVLRMAGILSLPRYSPPEETSRRIFDGQVAVCHIPDVATAHQRFSAAAPGHRNIERAVEAVRCWPTAYKQFQRLMTAFSPMLDKEIPEDSCVVGSSSTSCERYFGAMWATVYDPMGLAQSFVHEMAHNKLFGLGIFLESTQAFIQNSPGELFESPIRRDKPRPMTAVFHAEYSFIHVTALDIAAIDVGADGESLAKWLELLGRNVPRMEEGLDVIRRYAKLDRVGREFMDGFYEWADGVLQRGNRLLSRHQTTREVVGGS